jgi:hypothetical protein
MTWLKIHRTAMCASTIHVLVATLNVNTSYFIGITFILVPPHCTLIPNITTSVLFPIKYYQIGPRSTMWLLATAVVLFHIVIINERHSITTTIMHSSIFKPKTMDNSTAPSGRRGYKRLPNHGQNPRSSCVNDGQTDRPLVSIHYL